MSGHGEPGPGSSREPGAGGGAPTVPAGAAATHMAGYRPLARFGWYKRLHARLIKLLCASYDDDVDARKAALLGPLRGTVLEIGPGAGSNLRFYAPDVHWIGAEPNPHMERFLRAEAERLGRRVDVRQAVAEALPLPDASVDAVVTTLVLCTVHDVPRAMAEIRRVLRPGGRYVFIEHVGAPRGTGQRRLQRAIKPVWRLGGDGCEPDREIWRDIEAAGFDRLELEHFLVRVPIVGPHIAGTAYSAPPN